MMDPSHQNPPPQGSATGRPPGPLDPGGWSLPDPGRRIGAFLLDHLIIGLTYGTVIMTFFGGHTGTDVVMLKSWQGTMSLTVYAVAWMVVSTMYFGVGNGNRTGQTLGKKALGIQVRDGRNGGPIGILRGAARYLIPGPLNVLTYGVLLVVDAVAAVKDPQRVTLHDKLANSLVVTARRTNGT